MERYLLITQQYIVIPISATRALIVGGLNRIWK